uniref:Uncharacterized protein n=1 Tax=Rhizophagus irregularis (strain DAOM 181602 / DAOM 197198 / MUCL 43194) TaxID=747089 RepID=U9TNS9_RHIID
MSYISIIWNPTCIYLISISDASCKYQDVVSIKFHISTLLSLTFYNHMLYAYIALNYTAKDNSFYASLHIEFTSQNQKVYK